MESHKISTVAKSVVLENGLELTYCEFGEQNEEVLLSGAFYFHTFTPVVEGLAKRYHVYGIVMRMDTKGPFTQFNADGTVNWDRQWGDDIYQFAKAMGIEKFHYAGKCHGVNPGWYMVKEHPEMLDTFASLYLVPHLCPRNATKWIESMAGGIIEQTKLSIRHQERVPIKMAEIQTLATAAQQSPDDIKPDPNLVIYPDSPQLLWDNLEECEEAMRNVNVPILLMFGTEDILFNDYFDSNIKAMQIIPRAKTVLLQGERHLLEMDCAERMVSEIIFFIDESRKNYD